MTALKRNVELISGTINNNSPTVTIAADTTGTTTTTTTGTTGLSLVVSSQTMVLPALPSGGVSSYASANGLAKMYSGTTDVTASTTFSLVATGCTATINTVANSPVAAEPLGYYQVTNLAGTVGSFAVTGIYDGQTLTDTVSVVAITAGYPIVTTLPTTGTVGEIVFLTTYDGSPSNTLWRYDGIQWLPLIVAVDVQGQIDAAQIQDGTITAAKLLSGLQPIQLVTALPTPGDVGRIVYLVTGPTPQLYYDTGAAWTTQIIDGSQITDNSITAGQIQAGAITTDAMIANSIDGDRIQAGTLTADKIFANSITSAQIAANTITGGQIAAGSILTNNIGAGQITAALIGVTSLSAVSANMGIVTAGIIESTSGQTKIDLGSGTITVTSGGYTKITGNGFGSSNQFLEWYGPTQSSPSGCTETNAVYYLGVGGNAYFGGTLLAGKLVNSVEGTILDITNVADLGPYSSNGGTITITSAYTFVGTKSFPATAAGLAAYNAQVKSNPTATVVLSQSVGGAAFTVVQSTGVTGSWTGIAPIPGDEPGAYTQNMSLSATYGDYLHTTATREYTLSLSTMVYNTNCITNTLSLTSVE